MNDASAEAFHRYAIAWHRKRVIELCRTQPTEVTDELRLAVCDAVSWSYRFYAEVLKPTLPASPHGETLTKIADGVRWLRHRIIHGDAQMVTIDLHPTLDDRFNSHDILWNDPESDFNGQLVYPTARLRPIDHEVPNDGQPKLRPVYNEWVSGRRVIVVCGLLAGEHTLGTLEPPEGDSGASH